MSVPPQPHVLPELPGVTLLLKRSARARRISLRVSRIDASVSLTLPERASVADGLAFARAQAGWLRQALSRMPRPQPVAFGMTLPVEGRALLLVPGRARAPVIEGDWLVVGEDPARLGIRVETYLRHLARLRLQQATERYAAALGRPFRKITLRDTRSRWGSCAADGSLSYSWRLAMAPPSVLDYVAAHEVAHLAQMNHSPAFWAVVARLRPDYATHRAWLKREGAALQAIRFRGDGG